MPPAPAPNPFDSLKQIVREQQLLQRDPRGYLPQFLAIALLVLATAAGIVTLRTSPLVLLFALLAAFLFGQLGFLAHDATHNQIFRRSKGNYVASVLLFNLVLGGSRGWWADKHNRHHRFPNRETYDPDITGGPIVTSVLQARQQAPFWRPVSRHQVTFLPSLMALSVPLMRVDGLLYCLRRGIRHVPLEVTALAVHYAAYITLLVLWLGAPRAIAFIAIHQLVFGVYLGLAFLPNHVGMPVLPDDDGLDFFRRQVLTSRNFTAGRVSDYLFGALSCQIEHHLFPSMPRHNLRRVAPHVRALCQAHGVPYHETTPLAGYREVLTYLGQTARQVPLRHRRPAAAATTE